MVYHFLISDIIFINFDELILLKGLITFVVICKFYIETHISSFDTSICTVACENTALI